MAEKFEFKNAETEGEGDALNPLMAETMEARAHMRGDRAKFSDAEIEAITRIAESLSSIMSRLAELPKEAQDMFFNGNHTRQGSDFPAYEVLRGALSRTA